MARLEEMVSTFQHKYYISTHNMGVIVRIRMCRSVFDIVRGNCSVEEHNGVIDMVRANYLKPVIIELGREHA